jgi:hypothetical protein
MPKGRSNLLDLPYEQIWMRSLTVLAAYPAIQKGARAALRGGISGWVHVVYRFCLNLGTLVTIIFEGLLIRNRKLRPTWAFYRHSYTCHSRPQLIAQTFALYNE